MEERIRPDGEALALPGEPRNGSVPCLGRPSALSLLPDVVRQAWYERRVRWLRHLQFRSRENRKAREAYAAMEPWEFEGVNARQAWANWRTIPKNLNGLMPREPVRALDLCCGTGQSTAVLAYHLPPGSEIVGLDFSPRLVEVARSRPYRTCRGAVARVRFRVQSVLETLRGADGAPLPPGSVDLVNSSGAVGCHFDAQATKTLAAEVARVVRPGGLALIDSGRSGTRPSEVQQIFERHGFVVVHRARSCLFDPYLQLCLRKDALDG